MKQTRKFGSRKGATFIEYALLAGLVAIIVAAAAMFFGEDLKGLFTETSEQTHAVSEGVKNTDITSTFDRATKPRSGGGEQGK